jgi:hypothetical protein
MKMAENILFVLQVEEAYLLAQPGIGPDDRLGRVFKGVWLRPYSGGVNITNHSLYRDNNGIWWWYNDNTLTELPEADVSHFGRHYNNPFLPPEEKNHHMVKGVVEVIKTTYN